jgi:hypothetical protein
MGSGNNLDKMTLQSQLDGEKYKYFIIQKKVGYVPVTFDPSCVEDYTPRFNAYSFGCFIRINVAAFRCQNH